MKLTSKFIAQPWLITTAGLVAFADSHSIDVRSIDLEIEDLFTPRAPMEITPQGVAIVSVSGTLLNGAPPIFSKLFGDTNYQDLTDELESASKDSRVKGILLSVNSPGGSASGCGEVFEVVAGIQKPVIAYAGEMACSAAYYIAAGADLVYAAPSSIVGCIGSVMTMYDISAYLEKIGIEAIQFASGWFKGAGTDGVSLTDDQKEFIQDFVNQSGNKFKADMTAARGIDQEAMEGQHYWAHSAPPGMIDHVGGIDQAITDLLSMIG